MTTTPPRDYKRLATVAKMRRFQLGMSLVAAARAAGISKDTYRRIEEELEVRAVTYAKIDPAFGWATGSCEAILHGGQPVPLEQPADQPVDEAAPAAVPAEDFGPAIVSAMVAATDMSAAQIRDITKRVMDELARRGVIRASESR